MSSPQGKFAVMQDDLMLPVTYQAKELEFPFRVATQGYVPRYIVLVDDVEVFVETDDQGALRAIIYNPELVNDKLPEKGLLEAITSVIQMLTA